MRAETVGDLKKKNGMKLPLRVIIVSVVDISVTDSVVYYHLKHGTGIVTLPLLVEVIAITLIPIALVLLVWLLQQRKK
jgi:hypothetical protein